MMTDKIRLNHDLEFWREKLKKYEEKQKTNWDMDTLCTISSITRRIFNIERELKNAS